MVGIEFTLTVTTQEEIFSLKCSGFGILTLFVTWFFQIGFYINVCHLVLSIHVDMFTLLCMSR